MASERDSRWAARERVSAVPVSNEVGTASRSVQVAEIPARWLDRLLVAATELPIEDGEAAVAKFVVETLADLLPQHGVGACLVVAEGSEQQVIKVCPPGEELRGVETTPTRIFPGYLHERVFDVDGTRGATTLHIASDEPLQDDANSGVGHLATRSVALFARGLHLARTHTRAENAAADLRSANAQLLQAEKLASLGTIAAGVVHELNNPLTSIVAYTDYLARKTKDEDALNRLRRIGESAERMLRFTRDLVTYARPSSEEAVPVMIHTVIDQALAFCEHVLAEAGARVERRFSENVPAIDGMPTQLAQVFVNLVTNACHAMPSNAGQLVITTSVVDQGRVLVVHVDDNGHGIEPQLLTQVFNPFFSTKGEGRGTGLGLSIVRNIVDSHRGEVRAERIEGAGTRFVLRFPTRALVQI